MDLPLKESVIREVYGIYWDLRNGNKREGAFVPFFIADNCRIGIVTGNSGECT